MRDTQSLGADAAGASGGPRAGFAASDETGAAVPGDGSAHPAARDVVLLTRDASLTERVAPAVAACGMRLHVTATAAHPRWASAAVALLDAHEGPVPPGGSDRLTLVLAGPRADEGADEGADELWRTALARGARDVLRLPADAARLLASLQAVRDPDRGGTVVGVLGGRGGAGASVLAAELAVVAARSGSEVLLCDADPLGGGVDLLLDDPPSAGLRWNDLVQLTGPLRPGALRAAVPRAGGGPGVLTWQPGAAGEVPPEVVRAALDAGRRGHDLVVVDLPRGSAPTALAALSAVHVAVLLVPAEVRAVAAAAGVLDLVRHVVADVRLCVRAPAPGGLPVPAVSDALGLPVSARWPSPRALTAALDRADPPGRAGRRALSRAASRLLRSLVDDDDAQAPISRRASA